MTNPQFPRWDISATRRPSQRSALHSCSAKPCADAKGPRDAPKTGQRREGGRWRYRCSGFRRHTAPSAAPGARERSRGGGGNGAPAVQEGDPPALQPPLQHPRGFRRSCAFLQNWLSACRASGRPVPCKHPPRPRGRQSPVERSERSPSPHSPRRTRQTKGGLRQIPSAGKF